jgi:hypothetical protein
MRTVDSWIDSDQLAKLGEELTGEIPPAPEAPQSDTTRGPDGLGLFDDEQPESSARSDGNVGRIGEQLAEIKARASRSGLLRSTSGAPLPVGVEVGVKVVKLLPGTGASLVERLESFVSWAIGQEGLTGLFIADFAGNELVESGADPSLVASGVALAEGWERARGELESTAINGVSTGASVRDAEGSMLTVFSCRSAYGRHVLGALTPEPLGNALSAGLRAGFARVMGVGNL